VKKCSFFWPPRTCEKMFIFLTTPELWKNVHFFDHPGPVKYFHFFDLPGPVKKCFFDHSEPVKKFSFVLPSIEGKKEG
jgi:hypothetical protein